MKNKIYNAIQKGLSNILVFDDNESTVSYQKSDINNEIQFPQVSLDELHDIFENYPNTVFKYKTTNCLTLILENNQEISLHEYKSSDTPVFLKISNNILKETGNEIIIACNNNHYISDGMMKWSEWHEWLLQSQTDYEYADKDLNGYAKCLQLEKHTEMHGIQYCKSICPDLNGYTGYLPASGQFNIIGNYLPLINYIFNYIGDSEIPGHIPYWTSSEQSDYDAIFWDGELFSSAKSYEYYILPIFKKIN